MDIDNHCIELPEDFPQLPNRTEFIQEISEVLLRFGLAPSPGEEGGAPPTTTTTPVSGTTTPGRVRKAAVALRQLEDDGRNGNLAGEELAVLELLQV